jgi:hypothetical protein
MERHSARLMGLDSAQLLEHSWESLMVESWVALMEQHSDSLRVPRLAQLKELLWESLKACLMEPHLELMLGV